MSHAKKPKRSVTGCFLVFFQCRAGLDFLWCFSLCHYGDFFSKIKGLFVL